MLASAVIDAGHGGGAAIGGSTPNRAVGPAGMLEKDVALDLARRVRRLLAVRGVPARLTRDGKNLVSGECSLISSTLTMTLDVRPQSVPGLRRCV